MAIKYLFKKLGNLNPEAVNSLEVESLKESINISFNTIIIVILSLNIDCIPSLAASQVSCAKEHRLVLTYFTNVNS